MYCRYFFAESLHFSTFFNNKFLAYSTPLKSQNICRQNVGRQIDISRGFKKWVFRNAFCGAAPHTKNNSFSFHKTFVPQNTRIVNVEEVVSNSIWVKRGGVGKKFTKMIFSCCAEIHVWLTKCYYRCTHCLLKDFGYCVSPANILNLCTFHL